MKQELSTTIQTESNTATGRAIACKRESYLEEMLLRHSPMVRIIVARMRDNLPSHADLEELESMGLTGLIAAINRFDASRGYTFETYASIRIRGAILDGLRAMDMTPRSVRTKQRKLSKTIEKLEQDLGRAPLDSEVREALGLDEKQYQKLRMQTQPVSMVYLDRQAGEDEGTPHDLIADETLSGLPQQLERTELQELVSRKIMELPAQQRKVLALYFHEEMRLAEIGEVMGISEARVSQIRTQALEHLRKFVRRMTY